MSDPTEAYARALPRTWRHRTEAAITRIRDLYDAGLDYMPAIAAFVFLLWLINVVTR